MAKIWRNIEELAVDLKENKWRTNRSVLTTGGFDPLTFGHLCLLRASSACGERLIVLVNDDQFLLRKKGYVFTPLQDRLELISDLHYVDDVVAFGSAGQFVDEAIKLLKPTILTKGGDRTPETMASQEIKACELVGTRIIYNVGGDKIRSSQELVKSARLHAGL